MQEGNMDDLSDEERKKVIVEYQKALESVSKSMTSLIEKNEKKGIDIIMQLQAHLEFIVRSMCNVGLDLAGIKNVTQMIYQDHLRMLKELNKNEEKEDGGGRIIRPKKKFMH